MRKLSLEEVKEIQLSILHEVAHFCDKNDITYSLCGGTLLGAIRHKGYIPWDDDIDIMMPRPDYERLLKEFESEELKLYHYRTTPNFSYPFCKIGYINSVLNELMLDYELNTGINIDVFPIDGFPEGDKKIDRNIKKINVFRKLLSLKIAKNKKRTWYKAIIVKAVKNMCSYKYITSNIDGIGRKDSFQCSKFAGIRVWGYRRREICPQETFVGVTEVEFEGSLFKAFKLYDQYLTIVFGDYMALPPKNEQVSHHDFESYLIEGK